MPRLLVIRIPVIGFDLSKDWKRIITEQHGLPEQSISGYQLRKKSLDARGKKLMYECQLQVFIDEPFIERTPFEPRLRSVHNSQQQAIIVGAGPAGLFAALRLIQQGIRPLILERGKNVRDRRRDLAAMNKQGLVNPESNYCFGEGGAGTYSDGKLYTRSNKRGDVEEILQWLVYFGADDVILYEAHPHIGTNKLPRIIERIRETIIEYGGEVQFGKKLTDVIINDGRVKAVSVNEQEIINTDHLILATGHSARDIFYLLFDKKIYLESKPFALGVRIEHPQNLIDNARYHCNWAPQQVLSKQSLRPDYLPAATYALVSKKQEKSVYSFCMCPGGIIAPASTDVGEIVVNGWSPSKRNNPYANSGMVVAVDEKDFAGMGFSGPLGALQFQQSIERRCYEAVADGLKAPAVRVSDFVQRQMSSSLPDCSYLPGIVSANLDNILPKNIVQALRGGIKEFAQIIKGFITEEAVMVATESRTSSPVRIPRDGNSYQHPQVKGLYPCAEGAGYAGGIVSAAIDGMKCAEALKRHI